MSVINKTPLINEILSGLDEDQLLDLKACINGDGPDFVFRSLKPNSPAALTEADYGVTPVKLELNFVRGGLSLYKGYLIYTEAMCFMICYTGDANQGLMILRIDPSKFEAEITNGSLTITELRSELDDELDQYESGGSEEIHGSNIMDLKFSGYLDNHGGFLHIYMLKDKFNEMLIASGKTQEQIISEFNNATSLEQFMFFNTMIGSHFEHVQSIYQSGNQYNFDGSVATDDSPERPVICLSSDIDDAENPTMWGIDVCYLYDLGSQDNVRYKSANLVYHNAGGEDTKSTLSISELDLGVASGSGSGDSSPILYRHSIPLSGTIDNPGDSPMILSFLSKYDNFNATDLATLTQHLVAKHDEHVIINPQMVENGNERFAAISSIWPKNDNTGVDFLLTTTGNNVSTISCSFEDNTSITDTVTPYLMGGSGGSGGGDTPVETSTSSLFDISIKLDLGAANSGHYVQVTSRYIDDNDRFLAGLNENFASASLPALSSLEDFGSYMENLYTTDPTIVAQLFILLATMPQVYNHVETLFEVYTEDVAKPMVYNLIKTHYMGSAKFIDDSGTVQDFPTTLETLLGNGFFVNSETRIDVHELCTSGGSGSGSSIGGSGKLYQYNFTLKVYDNGTNPEYDLEFLLYESNFERIKSGAQSLGFSLNEPQDIATFINSLSETEPTTTSQQTSTFLAFSALVDKVNINIRGGKEELFPSLFAAGLYGPEGSTPRIVLADDTTEPITYYGLNTNNSCILTEYGTSGGSGSGSGTGTGSIKRYLTTLNFTYQNDNDSNYSVAFAFFEKDLDDTIELLNQALAQADISVVLTKSNWAATIPTLINQMMQLDSSYVWAAFTWLMNNAYQTYGTDIAGMYDDLGIVGGIRLAGRVLGWQDIEFTTATLSELEDLEVSVSGGGSSGLTENPYCYVQLGVGSNHLIYLLDRKYTQDTTMVNNVNALITQLNSTFSVSIPSYAKIEDLETIASYINNLSDSTYAQLKVVFWSTVFATYQYYALSVKLYYQTSISPVLILAESDPSQSAYSYSILALGANGTSTTIWSESDTVNFEVRVNQLD